MMAVRSTIGSVALSHEQYFQIRDRIYSFHSGRTCNQCENAVKDGNEDLVRKAGSDFTTCR
jgi:hypothetical protein